MFGCCSGDAYVRPSTPPIIPPVAQEEATHPGTASVANRPINPHAEAYASVVQQMTLDEIGKAFFTKTNVQAVFNDIELCREDFEAEQIRRESAITTICNKTFIVFYFPHVPMRDVKSGSKSQHRGFFTIEVIRNYVEGAYKQGTLLFKCPRLEKPFHELRRFIRLEACYERKNWWIWKNEERAAMPDFASMRPKNYFTQFFAQQDKDTGDIQYIQIVVQQWCPKNLKDYIETNIHPLKDMKEKAQKVQGIAIKILRLVKGLHNLGFVHRDLKPINILIGEDGQFFLTDFGFMGRSKERMHYGLGSSGYMAPECSTKERRRECLITNRIDVFAVGAIMYFALTGEKLYTIRTELTKDPAEIENTFLSKLEQLKDCPLQSIIGGMLKVNPQLRMGVGRAIAALEGSSHFSVP